MRWTSQLEPIKLHIANCNSIWIALKIGCASALPVEGTVFCSSETGFSIVSVSDKELKLYMLDKNCNILHTVVPRERSNLVEDKQGPQAGETTNLLS